MHKPVAFSILLRLFKNLNYSSQFLICIAKVSLDTFDFSFKFNAIFYSFFLDQCYDDKKFLDNLLSEVKIVQYIMSKAHYKKLINKAINSTVKIHVQ